MFIAKYLFLCQERVNYHKSGCSTVEYARWHDCTEEKDFFHDDEMFFQPVKERFFFGFFCFGHEYHLLIVTIGESQLYNVIL